MFRLAVFAGTTEGRELAERCAAEGIEALVFTATEYGGELLPEGVNVRVGRLTAGEMAKALRGIPLAVDATHPYAREATANIRAACGDTGTRYIRLLRESCTVEGETAADMGELIAKLNGCDSVILSALGSKALEELSRVKGAYERIWLRLLPAEGIRERCISLGFDGKKLILEKPPFSAEENIRHIRLSGAEVLLTKESGAIGGYPEKAEAARLCGVRMITLARHPEEGADAKQTWEIIRNSEYGIRNC